MTNWLKTSWKVEGYGMLTEKTFSPIIVCGSARSGTTFVWRLLDSHPQIAMSDEFFIYKTPSLVPFFQEMNATFNSLVNRGDLSTRKEQIMRMLWFYTSNEKRLKKGMTVRRYGNKTPGAEHYIDFYDDVFEKHPPLYIYLLRKGKDVFLSVRNTEWGKNANMNGLVNRYLESIKAVEAFQEINSKRIFILKLDKIGNDEQSRMKMTKSLFEFVGEEIEEEMMPFLRAWKPVHTTQDVRRNDPDSILRELPEKDIEFLEYHEEYQHFMNKYGYE